MERGYVERRRQKRVALQAPLLVRKADPQTTQPFEEHQTGNVGLGGLYFETEREQAFAANDAVITSVSVPGARMREFPFTRIAGRGRVVRIQKLPKHGAGGTKRFGVGIEFGNDVTALSAIPSRA